MKKLPKAPASMFVGSVLSMDVLLRRDTSWTTEDPGVRRKEVLHDLPVTWCRMVLDGVRRDSQKLEGPACPGRVSRQHSPPSLAGTRPNHFSMVVYTIILRDATARGRHWDW